MKYLGIDYGTKQIGLAISDSGGQCATAYGLVENITGAFEKIGAICESEGIQAIVLGHSVDFQGKENSVQEHIDRFTELIQKEWGLEVFQYTELLSSMQAKWGVTKPLRRSQKQDRIQNKAPAAANDRIDAGAAAIILQGFLDTRNNN